VDIFEAAGLQKPDISILSDTFLNSMRDLPHRNLAIELLQRLLSDELKARSRTHLVQSRNFSEMLQATLLRYQNRTIEAAQVITELIQLAQELQQSHQRGEQLGLSEEELGFYEALSANESAVEVMGDEQLSIIAREVLKVVRNNVKIDWTVKESVRANLRRLVRRVLRQHGYPPDMQEKATQTVLQQAELLARDWAG
jgi:type I restriction enzyme, R subunit